MHRLYRCANVFNKRGKYSDKIAYNKIKRGLFCKILVILAIKCKIVTCKRFRQVQRDPQEAVRETSCDSVHWSRYSGMDRCLRHAPG